MTNELETYKEAFELACWLLSKANGCFDGYCPLEKTNCPDCGNYNVWQEYFLQKAREER